MSEARFEIGELIENRYRVLSVIGSGGMGVLYRVSDEAHRDGVRDNENIALKMVRLSVPTAEKPESIERFQREFQVLTQLQHPNLVSVHDYGATTGGGLYFTMEWVEGEDLEPSLRPLEPAATIPVMVQVCRALAYLHARGVIHGDLKPRNVLMAGDRVKIVDFGVAFEVRTPDVRSRYCTPGYAAPEMRQPRPVDHRADLYSLGALWYALLLGEPPMFMPGAGKERLIRFSLEEALEAQSQIPKRLGEVIARLMATAPENRYGNANKVIEAVNEVTGSEYRLETQETASSYALRTHFVNREAELKALRAVWEQARSDEGKLVLICGEAGVGKTRLVEELEVQAELEGAWVVWGQCVESGGSAYHPWREALRVLMRYVEGADGAGLEIERVGPVLAALLPELWEREYMQSLSPPAELDPQAAQQRLNDNIVQVLRATAGLRPTMVMIEDGQWADEATLELLRFLARAPGSTGLVVCATYRDDEVSTDHPLATLTGKRVQRIKVGRLLPKVTTDLARSMLGLEELPPLLVERVQRTTGGNALFVQELIRSLAAEGEVLQRTVGGWQVDGEALREARLPDSIRQVVGRRLAQLSKEGQQVLGWAAAVGSVFWEEAIGEAGQAARSWVRAALREGLEQALVEERDESAFAGEREYLFSSPTMREVSYESIPQEERREIHGRVAAWLMARSDEEAGEHLGLISDHLERAGQADQAAAYLRRAGDQAAAQFANAEAIAYFSRALDLIPPDEEARRYDLLLAREKVHGLQGAREVQQQDLIDLQELAETLDDDRRRAEIALRYARYGEATGDYSAAIAAVQTALDLAQTAQDVGLEAAIHEQWGKVLWRQGDYDAAQIHLEQALEQARAMSLHQVEADCLRSLGVVYVNQGDRVGAVESFQRALGICRKIDSRQTEVIVLSNLGFAFFGQGDYTRARIYYEQALPISQEIGDREGEANILGNLGLLFHRLGEDETAQEYSRQALLVGQETDNRSGSSFALTYLGYALEGLKRWAEATSVYTQALVLRREIGQPQLAIDGLAGLARVSLAQGNLLHAQTHVEEILRYEKDNTLGGTEDPFWVYLTCYRVLRASLDPRAQIILNTAHRQLQELAARISDEALRCSFLENVAIHQEILDEFAERREEMPRAEATSAPEDVDKLTRSVEQLTEELAEARRRIVELEVVTADLKQAEEETQWGSEQRFRSIAETASDAIIIFDTEENIFFWNRAAQNTFGYWAGETQGQLLASILSEPYQEIFRREIGQIAATGESDLIGKVIEATGVRKDGGEFPLEFSLAAWKTEEKVYFTAIGRDISERRRAEEALQSARDELEQRVRERTAELAQANAALQAENAERERAEAEIQRRNRELAALNRAGRVIASSLDPDEVLPQALAEALTMLDAKVASVLLHDVAHDELVFAAAAGPGSQALMGARMPAAEGVAGWSLREAQPALIHDVRNDPRYYDRIARLINLDVRSLLAVPLTYKGTVIGVMEAVNEAGKLFDEHDLGLLSTIAGSAAIAIENARLYETEREQRKLVEQSRTQLVQSEKLAATGRLAASLAHEINNPLQSIHNSLRLMLTVPLEPEEKQECLQMADGEVERLINIVTRILDFARPSRREKQPTDVNDVLEKTLALTDKYLQNRRVILWRGLTPKLPSIAATPDELGQVFLNIVLNAVDAMLEGGDLSVSSRLAADGRLKISFADNGVGIPPEHLDRIFEPFFSTREKGTGLGLSISYGVIERYGGEITVQSGVGEGTTFTVWLPVLPE